MTITWNDLTVENADEIRDFYEKTMGWNNIPVDMGGYNDYVMVPSSQPDSAIGGICHKRGPNTKLPPVWIPYIEVDDLAGTLERCKSEKGELIDGPRSAGKQQMAIIKDPAGAYMGLVEKAKESN